MTLPEPAAAAPIAANARCATCAAALAPDQMFCLSCGTRRRDARIAFRDVLATEAAPVITPVSGGAGGWPPHGMAEAPHGPVGPGRITYVPFIATLALLLFALGIGVWIGREPATAAAPVAGVPLQAVAATTPATTPEDEAAAASEESDKDAGDEPADEAADDEPVAPVKDDTSALKTLEKLSPEDYQKQSQKLPTEVGTGGTPPPTDNKPAGGGSEFESFE